MEKRKKKCLLAVLLMVATVFAINVACANDEPLVNSYPILRSTLVVPSGEVLDIAFEPLKYGYESNTLESIEIKNNTNEDLVVSGFDLENNDYFIMSTSTMFPMTVASGETKTVGSLSVTPGLYAGSYETNIIITDVNDNKYYGRVSVTVGGAEQPLKMQDQYMNTNSYIQIADLEKAVTGNKGKLTFALFGGSGDFTINNPEGYCKSFEKEGYARMNVTAEAVNVGGDNTPEWAETNVFFNIYFVEKREVKITGLEDNCVFEFDRYPKTPNGEIKLEGNKVTVGESDKVLQVSDLEVYYQGSGDTNYAQSSKLPMDVGTYSVTYKVPDDNVLFYGSTTYTFEIKKASLEKVVLDVDTFEYDGVPKKLSRPSIFYQNLIYWDGDTMATDADDYTVFVSLTDKKNYEWDDGTTDDLSLNWKITPKKLNVPTVSGEYEYNYGTQRVVLNDFDEDTMTLLYGEGMNAGTYDVTIVLKDRRNYAWKDDESSNDKIIKWVIKAIDPSYDIPQFLTGIEGEKLSSITFESGDDGVFSWNEPETILTAGTNNYKATYTPKNTNFNTITDIDVPVKVKGHFNIAISVNGGNGTIKASKTEILEDDEVEITFTPDDGYTIKQVLINGEDITSEVKDNKLILMPEDNLNIVVSYKKTSSGGNSSPSSMTYRITVTAPENATVAPKGTVKVKRDREQTFIIEAKKGYEIEDVLVDGVSVGVVDEYTFKKVRKDHTLEIKVKEIGTKTEEKEIFKDVKKNDWFYEAVNYVYEKKLMNGTGKKEFSPNISTTRGMIVTILYRLEGSPEVENSTFTDVASTEYYAKAVAWGEVNGIVKGYGEGKFGPNDVITREQLAAIMYRYSNYKKYDVSAGEDTNILSYNDISELSEYAVSSMQWACGESLVSGIGNNLLAPRGNATRSQVATILMRYCEKYMK